MAQRVAPVISNEMKKKIEYLKRSKENKGKRTKKTEAAVANEVNRK